MKKSNWRTWCWVKSFWLQWWKHTCKGAITGVENNAGKERVEKRNKKITFKKCALFTKWTTQVDAENPDVLMSMYNIIDCNDNYANTSGSLWQYHKIDSNGKSRPCIIQVQSEDNRRIPMAGYAKNAAKTVPLKYLTNFSKALEIPSINCERSLQLTWSAYYVITKSNSCKNIYNKNKNYIFQ